MKAKKERKTGLPELAPQALAADDSELVKGGMMRSEPASGDGGGGGTASGGATAGPAPASTTDATTAIMEKLNKAAQAQQDMMNSLSIMR